jgi:hypothetical protein
MTLPFRRVSAVFTSIATGVLLSLLPVAIAAQEGLYAPAVPEDAALVRLVNLQSSSPSPRIDAGPVRFTPIPAGEITPYRPVPPGVYLIGGRAGGIPFSPKPATFVTIAVLPGGTLELIEDTPHRDPARAQLVLVNRADAPASLLSRDPVATILADIPGGGQGVRAVNALTIELAVAVGETVVFNRPVSLERGESYTAFVTGDGAVLHTASVAPE